MARHNGSKRNRRVRSATARRRREGRRCERRCRGVPGVRLGPAGCCAASAHADEFGAILDPMINSIAGWLERADPSAGLAGLDLGGLGWIESCRQCGQRGCGSGGLGGAGERSAGGVVIVP